MKIIYSIILIALFFLPTQLQSETVAAPYHKVCGRIIQAGTKNPIAGILVELVELNLSTVSDSRGFFCFASIPPGKFTMVPSSPRFIPDRFAIKVPSTAEIQLSIRPLPIVSETVTVTAAPWVTDPLDTAQSTYAVAADDIQTRSGLSLGEAVKDLPGVRNISTGDAGGVPVIRGQSNERVRVLSNGMFHDYFQFSRRHMPNIEPYEADHIEIVSGPSSVLYGPQANSGVVNIVSAPLPFPVDDQSNFSGRSMLGYAGINQAETFYAQIEGGQGGFAGRAAMARRATGNMGTPAGDLPNTDYVQQSASLETGYQFANDIVTRFFYRHWENELGFYIPLQPNFRLGLRNDIGGATVTIPTAWGKWDLDANLSQNIRRAFPLGRSQGAKVDLELDTQLYRLSFQHNPLGPLQRGVIRLEHSRQSNETFGPVKLLPCYDTSTWSVMIFEESRFKRKKMFDHWTLNAGLRFDQRALNVPADLGLGIARNFAKTYQALTGAAGLVYRLNRFFSSGITISRGWRNPSEFELFANGPHDGVQLFEKGNPDLREETNLNTEFTIRLDHDRVRGSLAFFRNAFSNYIYLRLTGETIDGLPVSTFDQCDAAIKGIEGHLDVDLTRQLTMKIQGETLYTHNDKTGMRLPFTPPDRAAFSIRLHDFLASHGLNPFTEFRSTWTGKGKIAGPDEPFPLETESYVLFDLGAGVKKQFKNCAYRFDLWIGNLTNKSYKDFLDTYKQYAQSAGRNIRLTFSFLF
ncbi:MAG: TonB-dependent receptor [Acidobacteria bacterium]|nr:TonB-dependent receptor [Acidobacteriota bacterium]MBU4308042.1 TonB-dependent receptor [Acidobacteriota bacterium]MBU4405294.1 TonB-dependent receptor [Acidobacteriota bacterium]MCG2810067.1 TonB-dependent receptor [Candidatus Aminicenantes bacterium]